MIREQYEEAGRPLTSQMNVLAMPPEILQKLGTITNKGQSLE